MRTDNVYVDFHILQTFPPSCVNRDDTGSPKTATYGGVTRARISSQAQKHAMRIMFTENFEPKKCGLRTKHIVGLVEKRIVVLNTSLEDKAKKLAADVLAAAGLKIKADETGTDALFFISDGQVQALAELAANNPESIKDKKACQAALKSMPSIDMALFGRMVASDPSLNYDACAQVAHSISTHAVQTEYDYFTAVDDMASEDNAGAGHLGTVEYNSSTQYRYATINVTELNRLLGNDTAEAVCGFAEAFIRSMPTGKQNTFANRTAPDDVYVTIRKDQPVNLVTAFEKPVVSRDGFIVESERRLVEYAQKIYSSFVAKPEAAWAVGDAMKPIAETMSLTQLIDELRNWVQSNIGGMHV